MGKLLEMFFGSRANTVGGSININGQIYSGNSVTINNGIVTVDGKQAGTIEPGVPVNVVVNGPVERLETSSGDVVVNGDVGYAETVSGDVQAQRITGSVKTVSGDVDSHAIGGSVSTVSGDITRG